jgi:kynurenine formamidase
MTLLDPARIIDLTEPWSAASWPYPGHPRATEAVLQTYPRDRINTWSVTTSMHTGTHVDGPLHCTGGGADLASIPFDTLVRPGYVVDLRDVAGDWHVVEPSEVEARLPGPLEPGDALILRYGWQRFGKGHPEEDAERFFSRHPGPGRALVQWMLDREVAWVGTDAASFEHPANINLRSTRPDLLGELAEAVPPGSEVFDDESWMIAHRRLLEQGRLHVDQAGGDLDAVPAERVTLGIFPWRYSGGEASICRLVAIKPG